MINIRSTTQTMLRQRAVSGLVCRVALLQRIAGRIAFSDVGRGGRAP